MANLEKLAANYRSEGYSALLAEARVCQDIVLKAISESSLSRNVTIKGGVVMRSITGNVRRATRDIDFDFIKYSIDEASIMCFRSSVSCFRCGRNHTFGENRCHILLTNQILSLFERHDAARQRSDAARNG